MSFGNYSCRIWGSRMGEKLLSPQFLKRSKRLRWPIHFQIWPSAHMPHVRRCRIDAESWRQRNRARERNLNKQLKYYFENRPINEKEKARTAQHYHIKIHHRNEQVDMGKRTTEANGNSQSSFEGEWGERKTTINQTKIFLGRALVISRNIIIGISLTDSRKRVTNTAAPGCRRRRRRTGEADEERMKPKLEK